MGDEGVFVASIWRSEAGDLIGRVQMSAGRAEPTVEVVASTTQFAELLSRWLESFEHARSGQ